LPPPTPFPLFRSFWPFVVFPPPLRPVVFFFPLKKRLFSVGPDCVWVGVGFPRIPFLPGGEVFGRSRCSFFTRPAFANGSRRATRFPLELLFLLIPFLFPLPPPWTSPPSAVSAPSFVLVGCSFSVGPPIFFLARFPSPFFSHFPVVLSLIQSCLHRGLRFGFHLQ